MSPVLHLVYFVDASVLNISRSSAKSSARSACQICPHKRAGCLLIAGRE
jgi:hypothetical protein